MGRMNQYDLGGLCLRYACSFFDDLTPGAPLDNWRLQLPMSGRIQIQEQVPALF